MAASARSSATRCAGARSPCAGSSRTTRSLPMHEWVRPAGLADRLLLAPLPGHDPRRGLRTGPDERAPRRARASRARRRHRAARPSSRPGAAVSPPCVATSSTRCRREGRWDTVLLADGNIGIGGDPLALLRRAAELLHPGGRVVVDLAEPGTGVRSMRRVSLPSASRRRCSGGRGWERNAIEGLASNSGFHVQRVAERNRRWFAVLTS